MEDHLKETLRLLGFSPKVQDPFSGGDIPDIFLEAQKFIFEVKGPGEADPDKVRDSKTGETQFKQCERYVKAAHKNEGSSNQGTIWSACLTDLRKWWRWEWKVDKKGSLKLINPDGKKREFSNASAADDASWLERVASRYSGKPAPPKDPFGAFKSFQERLEKLYEGELSQTQGTITKLSVWMKTLERSGSAPSKREKESLFIQHTFLVTISRAVIASLFKDKRDPVIIMDEGFASWPHNPSTLGEAISVGGMEWTRDLFERIDEYDWKKPGRNMLRVLYTELVPEKHRKNYGEYYTPDWLAEAIVEKVCDQAWIKRSIKVALNSSDLKDVGVLDPACGSGTFLFHAAKRILNSKAISDRNLSDAEKTEVVTSLVMGIDIHPVAVEMAKATLLQALPVPPRGGEKDLRVFQGDSLLWNNSIKISRNKNQEHLATETDAATTEEQSLILTTPKGTELRFPLDLFTKKSFYKDIEKLLQAAASKSNKSIPITRHKAYNKGYLKELYKVLKKIITEESDSVWSWYIFNAIGPLAIRERGVDRIVANPPWVTMRRIQDGKRKKEFKNLGDELGLWGNRKANTGLDIASMFVIQCSNLYLQPNALQKDHDARSGWVLPWSSLRGQNWAAARKNINPSTQQIWDLRGIKRKPFKGAESAIWHKKEGSRPAKSPPETILVSNKKGKKVELDSPWSKVSWKKRAGLLQSRDMPLPNQEKPSAYAAKDKTGFTMGAPLVPHSLVKINTSLTVKASPGFKITTQCSTKDPWKLVGAQTGLVPKNWIKKVAKSTSLHPFTYSEPDEYVIPISSNDFDPATDSNNYWQRVEEHYSSKKGKGGSTGKTLLEHINFNNALLKQALTTNTGNRIVAYNAAGRYIRAARFNNTLIFEYSLFWRLCANQMEAKYLTSLLNADCLQDAYYSSQNSDRHFQDHFWWKVPIPAYNNKNKLHTDLVDLCVSAEAIAKKCLKQLDSPLTGQIKRSNQIRDALEAGGVMKEIDDTAKELLPKYYI